MKTFKLLILSIIVVLGLSIVFVARKETETEYYDLQIEAAVKMEKAIKFISKKRVHLGIPIDKYLDPLETGLIGTDAPIEGYSITTTLGSIDAKRTSTNPNFAALIVRYLKDIGVKKGDVVAVNLSGSFPALNIATIIALDILELKSIIGSSIGASSYGANIIDFTYLDMEKYLYNEGIINRKSDFISLGGDKDSLYGISNNDENFVSTMYQKYDAYDQIKEEVLKDNIKYRYRYYQESSNNIKAFVNVGGNIAGFGYGIKTYPNGLTKRLSAHVNDNSGLIDYFIRDDIPIIHLLNIIDLASRNEMEVDKEQPYTIGVGKQFYIYEYSAAIVIVTLVITILFLYIDYKDRKGKQTLIPFKKLFRNK